MDTQRHLEKLTTTSSLVGLAVGFFVLGILTLAKGDSEGVSMAGGYISVLLGTAFLMSAFSYWRHGALKS
jgi:succinate-acetate transporter protein